MAKVFKEKQGKVLIYNNKAIMNHEPFKSWFYITKWDSNGYFKAKTLDCIGDMPYDHMYGAYSNDTNIVSIFLKEFEINEGVTNISNRAFQECSGLKRIKIPSSITEIGLYAFFRTNNLTRVDISSIESWCAISFADSYSNPLNYKSASLYINGEQITNITIPSSIKAIKSYTFHSCTSLTSITIPDSVTSIGSYAFSRCSSLTNITIPNSVTSIGYGAFENCSSLTNIPIPNSVTIIEGDVFHYCSSLTSVTIPNSVTSIGSYAFSRCIKLTSIIISGSVTNIASYAFEGCYNCLLFDFRKATKVPALSSTIAFYGTSSSKKIVVPDSLYDSWITATNWSSTDYNIVTSIIKASDYEASL